MVPELKNLFGGYFNLAQNELQITLKVSDNSLLQYRALAGTADVGGGGADAVTNNGRKSNITCSMDELCVYMRTYTQK